MEFGSLEELERHVRKCMGLANEVVAEKLEKKGKQIIEKQVKGITETLQENVRINFANPDMVETEIFDSGYTGSYSWASVGYSITDARYGQHFFPMIGLEGGFTWGRKKTNIMVAYRSEGHPLAKRTFLSRMLALGVPIG